MVYLTHFDSKLHHAQHYIGFVDGQEDQLKNRMEYHRTGRGSKLLKALTENGISFSIVRIWRDGDRNFERQLKNRKKARILCPVCNQTLTDYETPND